MRKTPRASRSQAAANLAAIALLEQVSPLIMECGTGVTEFCTLAKWVFVRQAAAKLKASKQRISVSRIAITTGLTRAEVGRLLAKPRQPEVNFAWQTQRSNRVLAGWHSDPDYLSKNGRPMSLRFATGRKNFTTLVKRYSGDIPPRAMLQELISSGAIVERKRSTYLPRGQSVLARQLGPSEISALGSKLAAYAQALVRNLMAQTKSDPTFESMCAVQIEDNVSATALRRNLSRRVSNVADALQRYLLDNSPRTAAPRKSKRQRSIGVVIAVLDRRLDH